MTCCSMWGGSILAMAAGSMFMGSCPFPPLPGFGMPFILAAPARPQHHVVCQCEDERSQAIFHLLHCCSATEVQKYERGSETVAYVTRGEQAKCKSPDFAVTDAEWKQ